MVPSIASGSSHADRRNTGNGRLPMRAGGASEDPNVIRFPAMTLRNRMSALLVDNHRCCRLVQMGMLQYYGIETQAVETAQAAIDLLTSGHLFDLIVIDSRLPVLNGIETTRHIRTMGVCSKIAGLIGSSRERDRQAFLDAGADAVFEKPLVPERLVPMLMQMDGQI
ncbi:two-component response regulator 24 [Ricinus communis]|uniref:Histidine kinase 1 plant, putative n=1 Tax=Ricinus communis TaxID=3988 RepID=B9S584_RICCO|nr:two-component response regulator 24 [Ricinus communis]EEF41304.1 histidine kinase 1 plant, putative [Ricinus communis]|eukprot:XP_002521153.1 two-component response regulator 24 [Ricinus communis]